MDIAHEAVAELVERFTTAQAEDGYLNLHYQVVEKGMRESGPASIMERFFLVRLCVCMLWWLSGLPLLRLLRW